MPGEHTPLFSSPHLRATPQEAPHVEALEGLAETRDMFWQNVVREALLTIPLLGHRDPAVLDGRFAVLTRSGERIPIAAVEPLFPCSIGSPETKRLSLAVQATVFSVVTPTGEVFLLPLREIRGIHTVTDALMRRLEDEARSLSADHDGSGYAEPFGFAAFTALARQRRASLDAAAQPT